jgi:hypothetical protein
MDARGLRNKGCNPHGSSLGKVRYRHCLPYPRLLFNQDRSGMIIEMNQPEEYLFLTSLL